MESKKSSLIAYRGIRYLLSHQAQAQASNDRSGLLSRHIFFISWYFIGLGNTQDDSSEWVNQKRVNQNSQLITTMKDIEMKRGVLPSIRVANRKYFRLTQKYFQEGIYFSLQKVFSSKI